MAERSADDTETPEAATGTVPEAATETVPEAELWPSKDSDPETRTRRDQETVAIEIYIVTGRHGALRIPESFCRECNLFVRAADVAAEQVDVPVDVRVFSWWTRFAWALRHGGYHPPVMVVGGEKLCQGHHVPSTDEVIEAIEEAAAR